MSYIVLLKKPRPQSLKIDSEFIGVHNNIIKAAVLAYSYMVDGHEVEILHHREQDDSTKVHPWFSDPIFFATIKSEFKKREDEQLRTLALRNKPLRADDV